MRGKKTLCALLVMIMLVAMLPMRTAAAAGPAPAAGNHERWIDRIAALPDYAREFYSWMERNATASGALADPTQASKVSGVYLHRVHTLEGTVEFTNAAGADLETQAMDAAKDHATDAMNTAMDYIFDVYGAFDRDHPEVFWLNRECLCGAGINVSYTTKGSTVEVDYELSIYFYLKSNDYDVRLESYRDPAAIAAAIEKRDQDVRRILSHCPTDGSAEEQIRYLNKVLTESNAYNSAVASGNNSAATSTAWKCVSALSGSTGVDGPVCEGYARAFKVLCDRLDIPCVLTEGYARSAKNDAPEAHMWNYVQLEGNWYAVDVTWNDPAVRSKPDAALSGKEQEKWFLLGSGTEVSDGWTFAQSHPVRNEVNAGGTCYTNGPKLSTKAYATEQIPTEPQPTEPKPTEPKPTEPKPTEPKPTEPTKPEHYLDVAPYRSGEVYTAPEKVGYVFAGWFTDEAMTQPLGEDETTGYAYARFVSREILTVRWQIRSETTAESERTDLRLLTAISGRDFRYAAFRVGDSNSTKDRIADRLYAEVMSEGGSAYTADELFGQDAVWIVARTLSDISCEDFDDAITVTPCWCTLDGTLVTGTARTIRICDGY